MRNLEEAARWHGGLSGILRKGLIPMLAPYLLPGALEALRSGDISMDVQVQEAKTDRLTADLLGGRLDAVVMALPLTVEGLMAQPPSVWRRWARAPRRCAPMGWACNYCCCWRTAIA